MAQPPSSHLSMVYAIEDSACMAGWQHGGWVAADVVVGERANGYARRMRFVVALLCWVMVCGGGPAEAQQAPGQASGQAPGQVAAGQPDAQALPARTLSGVVTDADGALVPGAKVTLESAGSTQTRSTVTGQDGHFIFSGVEAGGYALTISAAGMESTTQAGALNEDESEELPAIVLRVGAASERVEVSSLNEQELAEIQMKQEEKQRLLGVIPNFYVTYDWKAAALTPKQKFKLAARALVDPATFVIVGGFAGIEQASNEFSGYGTGWAGYGKRYGAGLADASIGGFLGGAVFPVLFHQDPRYFYKGTGTVWQRTRYALSTAVIARGDNGKWQPAYASVLGDFASGAISNLYYPASDQTGVALTMENGMLSVAFDGVANLLQEFVLKKISTGIRSHGTPQP